MKKFRRAMWGVAALALTAVVTGCSGGSSNSTSLYAGTYTGSYAGTTTTGSAVSGRFTVTADASGNITGNLIGPTNTLPVTGTIDSSGNVHFTTPIGNNVTSVAGKLGNQDGALVGTGTFSATVAGVQNASSGQVALIRTRTTANPFTGNYVGTFTSTSPVGVNGTLNITADANGVIAGIVNLTGTATVYSAAGVVTPGGKVTVNAVGDNGGAPRIQFTTTYSGLATTVGTTSTIAGSYSTIQGGSTIAVGNFTTTLQPVP